MISGTDTGYTKTLTTDSAGFYSDGPLNPGSYKVTVTPLRFRDAHGHNRHPDRHAATSGSFKLTVGASTETVQVNAGQLQVNTDQPRRV